MWVACLSSLDGIAHFMTSFTYQRLQHRSCCLSRRVSWFRHQSVAVKSWVKCISACFWTFSVDLPAGWPRARHQWLTMGNGKATQMERFAKIRLIKVQFIFICRRAVNGRFSVHDGQLGVTLRCIPNENVLLGQTKIGHWIGRFGCAVIEWFELQIHF